MKCRPAISLAILCFSFGICHSWAQDQRAVVIRAGRLFDGKSDHLLTNQAIVVRGDRIAEVGPAESIRAPAGAEEIDLGNATVLPGLIDGHTHLFLWPKPGGRFLGFSEEVLLRNSWQYRTIHAVVSAGKDLEAGFTTMRDCSSVGARYSDVDVRRAINEGLVPGPRLQVATIPVIGSAWYPEGGDYSPEVVLPGAGLVADSPSDARKAVREDIKYGADLIKVFNGGVRVHFKSDGHLWENSTMTLEETEAIVDEAHRQGVKAACHAYADLPLRDSIAAGCDSIELGVDLDPGSVAQMARKGTFLTMTLSFMKALESVDLERSQGKFSRAALQKASFQRALRAGVKIAFGSDVGGAVEHGTQAKEFEFMVQYGMTPLEALRSTTMTAAELMGWQDRVGSIEPGKFADIIAVAGDPLTDITELERVKFVMKGGQVVRNSSN
jgi:imidazolonepropionase-like amidohydrolase